MTVPEPHVVAERAMRLVTDRLRATGFTSASVFARFAGGMPRQWTDEYWQMFARAAEYLARPAREPLDTLVRLLFLNDAASLLDVERVFTPAEIRALVEMRLVDVVAGEVISTGVMLQECRGLFIATDAMIREVPAVNAVMALIPECHELAGATVRRRVKRVIDLCTGSGVHALLASRHGEEVVGVDVSPRAIAFARFNKALNAIPNVDFVVGDVYGDVTDHFDLVVGNPPYVPTSDVAPGDNFYSGGPDGSAVWSRILGGLGERLNAGGYCQLVMMMVSDATDGVEKVRASLGSVADECDLGVLTYPIDWRNDRTAHAGRVELGLVTLRRRGVPGFVVRGALDYPLSFAMDGLFEALGTAGSEAERRRVVRSILGSGGQLESRS